MNVSSPGQLGLKWYKKLYCKPSTLLCTYSHLLTGVQLKSPAPKGYHKKRITIIPVLYVMVLIFVASDR